ncbi:MAG: FAD-binding oxidoreductase [Myxococcales bacterium]|nr:FAD-binding oxidoreductase [Myxococcales bacterium]
MQTATETFLDGLRAVVGVAGVSTTPPERLAYARDLWPRSQLERLAGEPFERPAAVVWPRSTDEVAAVVRACAAAGVPIVPFGAGSGVCGGARAVPGGVVVDLKRLRRVRRLDRAAGVVEVEAGLVGERFERWLEAQGLTLGHFPSSILCSTVGGWVAARSAGQCSSRYGKIEDMVVALEVVTGDGVVRRTAAGGGFDWNAVFVGSEGTLGIITAATLRVHAQPVARAYRGWRMPSVAAGIEVMRRTMQAGWRPAVVRLYDPLDTLLVGSKGSGSGGDGGHLGRLKALLAGEGTEAVKARATRLALSVPGLVNRAVRALPGPALLVTVCEGEAEEAAETDAAIAHFAEAAGGVDQGEGPGRRWMAHRYDVSYKQSKIYRSGAFVDTFEVATTWSRVEALYEAVRRAVGDEVLVMAHFSHVYPGGCSIYFTFVGTGRDRDEMRARYDRVWKAALDCAVARGAAIAHHHGAGLSRRRHMPATHGEARRWFAALKAVCDPVGIMNPGKLFAEEALDELGRSA